MKSTRTTAPCICIIVTLFITFIASGCSAAGDEYIGHWKNPNVDVTITRQDKNYIVDCKNPVGLLNGTYTATYENGSLKLSVDFLGSVTYLKSEDAILIAGAKLQRVK